MDKSKRNFFVVLKNLFLGFIASVISIFSGFTLSFVFMGGFKTGNFIPVCAALIGIVVMILILQSNSMIESSLRISCFFLLFVLGSKFGFAYYISCFIKAVIFIFGDSTGGEYGGVGFLILTAVFALIDIAAVCPSLLITALRCGKGKKDEEMLG